MRSIHAAAAAAGLTALLSAGCLLPPFDAEISLAYRSARKMTLVSEIGPMYFWRGHEGAGEFYFLPSQTDFTSDPVDPAAGHGLLVAADDYKVRVWYVDTDAAGNAGIFGERTFIIDSSNANRYNWQIQMLKAAAGSLDYFVLHHWGAATAADSGLSSVGYDRPAFGFTDDVNSLSWVALGMGAPGNLLGTSFVPFSAAGEDQLGFLMYDAATYQEYDFDVKGSLTALSGGTHPVPLPVAPPTNSIFYQRDWEQRKSVASWYDGSAWVTYTWETRFDPDPPDPALLPVGERIDVLLSTGELYHRGDQTDTVYGWDGRKKYEFPVGNMRLAGERYVAGAPTLFYTLIFWERRDGGDDRMYIRVYTLPTADLDELN